MEAHGHGGSRVHRMAGPRAARREDRFAKLRKEPALQRPEGPKGLRAAADRARREPTGTWVACGVGPRRPSSSP